MAIELTTPWGTFKYQKPIALGIATTLFFSGVSLLNGNFSLLLISYLLTNSQELQQPWYLNLFGFLVVLLSLYLYYLLIINWRKEIYSKLYFNVQKAVNAIATAHNLQLHTIDIAKLSEHHTAAYTAYRTATSFIHEHGNILDEETDKRTLELMALVAKQIQHLHFHIQMLQKNKDLGTMSYDPNEGNKICKEEIQDLKTAYIAVKAQLRKKERFRL